MSEYKHIENELLDIFILIEQHYAEKERGENNISMIDVPSDMLRYLIYLCCHRRTPR